MSITLAQSDSELQRLLGVRGLAEAGTDLRLSAVKCARATQERSPEAGTLATEDLESCRLLLAKRLERACATLGQLAREDGADIITLSNTSKRVVMPSKPAHERTTKHKSCVERLDLPSHARFSAELHVSQTWQVLC